MLNKKYHLITYGCQMNKSDSQKWAVKLEKRDFKPINSPTKADFILINVCSVRQSAINKALNQTRNLRAQNPKAKIVLTGCILKQDRKEFQKYADKILPIIDPQRKAKHSLQNQAYVPIMTGCNNFCSYCVVPHTRGREKSRPAESIIKEVKMLAKKGYEEIMLLGQNVNSYRSPNQMIDFPCLLRRLCQIPGNFQISFLTSHPKDMSDKLIEVMAEERKIKKEIHLPVQSGDNTILKKMNRGYTASAYKKLIGKIKKAMPDIIISTDIIVGFPGETEKQFQNTLKLVKEMNFCRIFVAAYSPRPQTAALKLKDNVPNEEKKRRLRIVLELIKKDRHPQSA